MSASSIRYDAAAGNDNDEASEDGLKMGRDLICSHPLYPLLSLIFERSELATAVAAATADSKTDAASSPSSAACGGADFEQDIVQFAAELEATNTGMFTGNQDLDSVMIQAIQVLRFHLLEIEKVHELCDNFCSRYIACLKGKMPTEMGDAGHHRDAFIAEEDNEGDQAKVEKKDGDRTLQGQGVAAADTRPSDSVEGSVHSSPTLLSGSGRARSAEIGPATRTTSVMENGESGGSEVLYVGQLHQLHHNYDQHHHHHQQQMMMQQLQATRQHPTEQLKVQSPPLHGTRFDSPDTGSDIGEGPEVSIGSGGENADDHDDLDDEKSDSVGGSVGGRGISVRGGVASSAGRHRQKKRGIFPKCATNVMRAWLFQHLSHPYPSEEQKKQLALDTGLTILQVNNWFINARRRIVQPMIDQSNRAGPHSYSPDAAYTSYAAMMESHQQQQQLQDQQQQHQQQQQQLQDQQQQQQVQQIYSRPAIPSSPVALPYNPIGYCNSPATELPHHQRQHLPIAAAHDALLSGHHHQPPQHLPHHPHHHHQSQQQHHHHMMLSAASAAHYMYNVQHAAAAATAAAASAAAATSPAGI